MPLTVESALALFADDSFLYRIIRNLNDTTILQSDLDKLQKWEEDWSMEFNPKKCKVLRITNKVKPIVCDYFINNEKIETINKASYLGLTINKNLNWKDHVNTIVSKATNVRHFLQRNLQSCLKETKLECYKIFIRPTLEYASSVWSPHNNTTLSSKIEMVQQKACRWIENKWAYHHSPTAMVKRLDLDSRDISCLKMLFDCVNGFKYMEKSLLPTRQRTTNVKYNLIHAKLKVYENSFFPYTIRLWNSLDKDIINIKDREEFRNSLNTKF